MRIAVCPAADDGSGWYRLRFPAEALKRQGADVVCPAPGPMLLWDGPYQHDPMDYRRQPGIQHRILGLAQRYEFDAMVIQRPARVWYVRVIELLQTQGVKVIVDVDDLLSDIHQHNFAHASYNKGVVVNQAWVDEACKLADLVTCSTPYLLKRYGYGHGVVLPNLVPEHYLFIYGLKRPKTAGWSGSVGSHPGDLQVTEGAIRAALVDNGWSFHVIGDGVKVRQCLRLTEEPTNTGWLPIDQYPMALAELELGIVPLEDIPFNRAKSALKASEMAALGVPVVMSPTPDNLRLHALGVGTIASSRGDWRRKVSHLMASAQFRDDMAGKGRDVMAGQTIEGHCGRWLEAWEGKTKVEV